MARYSTTQKALTQESTQQALLKLLAKKQFNEITITELTKVAGVSRMAFYRNYANLESVLAQVLHEHIAPIMQEIENLKAFNAFNISLVYLNYFKAHGDFFKLMLNSGVENFFYQAFSQSSTQFFNQNMFDHVIDSQLSELMQDGQAVNPADWLGNSSDSIKQAYATYWNAYTSAGLYYLSVAWIKRDFKEPAEFLAAIVTKLAG